MESIEEYISSCHAAMEVFESPLCEEIELSIQRGMNVPHTNHAVYFMEA
jgi:hypothetical protein